MKRSAWANLALALFSLLSPLRVCLRGEGQLLFGSVQGRPRRFSAAVLAPNTGRRAFQCAWLSEPGTLALVVRR